MNVHNTHKHAHMSKFFYNFSMKPASRYCSIFTAVAILRLCDNYDVL